MELNGNFYPFSTDDYYERLAAGSEMSVDSLQTSNDGGGTVTMSVPDSSVGSNNSRTIIMRHLHAPHAHHHPGGANLSVARPPPQAGVGGAGGGDGGGEAMAMAVDGGGAAGGVNGGGRQGRSGEDVLTGALMDERYATGGLEGYDEWTLDLRRLSMGPAFAQGAFGRLYRGSYDGEDVAVKILERPANNVDRAQLMEQQFRQEVMMLAALRHHNVVRFIGACRKPVVWCIVTEYARGGSVRSFLSKRKSRPVPLKLAVKQALDVAQGMEYLHGLGFIHRDLKSDNLLIATDKSIKIADFGVARIEVQTEGMTPETGTYRWMAPEMIQHRLYTHKVDVYSFGIVLWELITGCLPFQNMTAVQAAFAVVNKGVRPIIPHDCPPVLAEIISRCWDANPDVRPSFSQVVKMLEEAQQELRSTVSRAARFRCGCITRPMTDD